MEDLKNVYNKIYKYWSSVVPEQTWGFQFARDFITKVKKGRVLDLGCGAGAHSKFLWNSGLEVVGIDFSEKMIEEAKRKVPEGKFHVGDILSLDFPPNYFDGVFARASLLHIKKSQMEPVLQKLHNILKDRGLLYVAMKEGSGEKEVFSEYFKLNRFFALYTETELVKLLKKTGFKVIDRVKEPHIRGEEIWIQILASKA